MTNGFNMSIMGFPGATFTPIEKSPLVTNLVFIPLARNLGSVPGVLVDSIQFGAFNVSWQSYEYIMYVLSVSIIRAFMIILVSNLCVFAAQYPVAYGNVTQYFILHEGPEDVSRLFLLSAGAYADSLHDEIWVFDQGGSWRKNHGLWVEVQKANWDDVILADEFKKALKKDVYGFFESKETYEQLAIPWKVSL